MSRYLRFSLGPVQSFVAQARRTRDLWAGSFLLSWLTGHAMKAVIAGGGRIIVPTVQDEQGIPTDSMLKAIMGMLGHGSPYVGSLPNQFSAAVPGNFDPLECKKAMHAQWKEVADAVWNMFLKDIAETRTREIWDSQIANFWETVWVVGEADNIAVTHDWLLRRKSWRTHFPPDETNGADQCTVMGDWPELSGYTRAAAGTRQDAFWESVRTYVAKNARKTNDSTGDPGPGALNFREDERLCAIAFVKRLFPKLGKDELVRVIGWVPGEEPAKVGNWPSTAHMAAIRWKASAYAENRAACAAYVDRLRNLVDPDIWRDPGMYGETMTSLQCLKRLKDEGGDIADFANLDGDYLFAPELANPRATRFAERDANGMVVKDTATGLSKEGATERSEAQRSLSSLYRAVKGAVPAPTPFYAILLMDGDKFGDLLRSSDPAKLSVNIATFVESVKSDVKNCNGALIYAGGDDVLALLPFEDALDCAMKLRSAYRAAFDGEPKATISGAIVFAHYHLPLKAMLREAHRLLDVVAKHCNGRDSLAVGVWQGAGNTIEWTSTWDAAGKSPPAVLLELTKQFARDRTFSSRFLYKIRERLAVLADEKGHLVPGIEPGRLLLAEYLTNRDSDAKREDAERVVEDVRLVCQLNRRPTIPEETLIPDGALLVRFLADNGIWS